METETLLTKEGLERLKSELHHLKAVKRKEIAERIKEARKYGDISENSEYDEAKNEQAFMESRIKDLENVLRNAKIIEDDNLETTKVGLGTTVELKDIETQDIYTYTLVGSAEADPSDNKISNESPVGKAIMGREIGEVVSVEVPTANVKKAVAEAEIIKYEILDIRK